MTGNDADTAVRWAANALPGAYATVLGRLIDEAERDEQVTGLLLTGSVARRDALPGTDIDVRYVLASADGDRFDRGFSDGILLEQTFLTESSAAAELAASPMQVYAYLDGVILYDRDGSLRGLREQAERSFRGYRTPDDVRRSIVENLRHPEDKAQVGLESGDLLRALFCLSTTSWQLIEGLWAANDLPLPPNSSIRPHLRDLHGPADIENLFAQLFLADPRQRVETGLQLIGWVRAQLR